MCDQAKYNGEVCSSYEQIKHLTGISSDTTVSNALRELERAERIQVKRRIRYNGSRYDSNVYAISRALPSHRSEDGPPPLVQSLQKLETASRRAKAC